MFREVNSSPSATRSRATHFCQKSPAYVCGNPSEARLAASLPGWGSALLYQLTRRAAEPPKQEHEVVFLLNFFDELRRRVPAGK